MALEKGKWPDYRKTNSDTVHWSDATLFSSEDSILRGARSAQRASDDGSGTGDTSPRKR